MTNPLNQAGLRPDQTETTSTAFNVGTSVVQVAKNNPTRLSGFFVNIGTTDILLNINANVSIGNGILLIPQGGSFQVEQWSDYGFSYFPFYAISTAIGGNLMFVETNVNNL